MDSKSVMIEGSTVVLEYLYSGVQILFFYTNLESEFMTANISPSLCHIERPPPHSFTFHPTFEAPTVLSLGSAMTISFRIIVAAFLLSLCAANKTWQLLHSLDSGKTFSERGAVSLTLNEAGEVAISIANADSCLDLQAVNSLAGGLYQVKLIRDNDESTAVLTSVPACQVRRANFR